ncbi:MAG: anthranilate synthase component I [Alphaproteobacteria bacterium]|nr:anthranilate synthase component I [Alphaproteobacteria bacterium]
MSVSFADFEAHFNAGRTQLVWRWMSADLETPVSAYLKLCGGRSNAILLESIEGGEKLGRYSIIGFDPDLIWKDSHHSDPLASLKQTIADCKIDIVPDDLPPMAASGLFGYLGYDMVRLVEDIPNANPDDLGIPRSIMMRPQSLVIFDNVKNILCAVTPVYEHSSADAKTVFDRAQARLDAIAVALEQPIDPALTKAKTALTTPLDVRSNTTRAEYHAMVEKAVEYIHQGEIFQVVPGQRFEVDFDLSSFDLYRSLRKLNPSPFMVHLKLDDFALVASSPEILVRVREGTVTIRPIAGTRKRGKTPEEDQALAAELLADPKERAEHLMLLDLGRNDVGRVSEYGSVKVTEEFVIEYYSHVMHIVSNVEGKLRADLDIVDAHFAGFPAGTVSGAPKVRAMEIIDELEKSRRSYYGGSIGYFSGHGEMDSCIALRTALVKDGKVYVQAGGGVVADSDPDFEYQETVNKSKAIITAAEQAIEAAQ